MKADGSILIDTKIVDGGMEKGFELIKDEMSSVGITAKQVGKEIEMSFSKMDVSKPIANAVAKIQQLESQLAYVTSEHKRAIAEDDDKSAERLAAKRISVYNRLEAAREKLSVELAHAVQREAEAEEKAAQRAIRAAEKEAEAKQRATNKQIKAMTESTRHFGSRLREIVSGALVFNLISAGVRNVTQYFGSALKSSSEFNAAIAQLKGTLLTAFQPIYEAVAPAIIYLIRLLTVAAQVAGQFFAAISGKSYGTMQKNAEALYNQANGLEAVGGAAKDAKKQLMGFDEINRLDANETGGGGGGGTAESISPIFSDIEESGMTDNLQNILQWVSAIGAALMMWKISSLFTVDLSTIAGLAITAGGAVYYLWNWADAFANGIDWENLRGMLIGAAAVVGGLAVAFGPLGAAIGLIITGIGLAALALMEWIETGELSNEASVALVAGIMAIGAAIALLIGPGGWIALLVAGLVSAAALIIANWEEISNYFRTTFADGFLAGVQKLGADIANWLFNWWSELINWVLEELSGLVSFFSNFSLLGGETVVNPTAYAAPTAYSLGPDVPMLAKGAVIPPNRKFLAVLGDQTSGRNLEAPEDLIRQIVREEAGGDSGRVAQLLEMLIEVVEGIEVGDETIGRAAARYSRRISRAGGV